MSVEIFIGNIIHCPRKLSVELLENGFVAVQGKQILAVGDSSTLKDRLPRLKCEKGDVRKTYLKKSQILIPGLIDTHIHAPQYPNAGVGYDKTLLDWLDAYTFKLERQFRDLALAKRVFGALVRKTLNHGTTTACYYATLFKEASLVLVDSVIEHGQRALVGKVNMTKSSYADYVETEEESIENTVEFIENVKLRENSLVEPIITPRFALSMDMDHMKQLGCMAHRNNLSIQTHIAENVDEIRFVNETYKMPYADVYDNANILTKKTVLAHGIYLSADELQLISKRGSSIAHCPGSNTCLKSGLCDVRRLLEHGIKVGLGTDVSGGPSPSIINAMRNALDVSVHLSFSNEGYVPLTFTDVFYLATLGGAEALSKEDKIGNFVEGKEFDALIVDMDLSNAEIDYLMEHTPMEILQKFVYCGDDRNVVSVYVAGKNVKNIL